MANIIVHLYRNNGELLNKEKYPLEVGKYFLDDIPFEIKEIKDGEVIIIVHQKPLFLKEINLKDEPVRYNLITPKTNKYHKYLLFEMGEGL